MSTEPRNSSDTPAPPTSDRLLACPNCQQEMLSPDNDLPLHMSRGRTCIGSGTPGARSKGGQQIREPLTIPDVAQLGVSEILAADSCLACGHAKAPGQTICTTCHGLLPFLHQKCLPPYIKGYLFSDDEKLIAGHYTKSQFMEVFKSALQALADIRSGPEQNCVERT